MVVTFEVLKGILIRSVKLRIRNGDCTERQLARLIGVSQPQLHNVLKGARPLKGKLADSLLKYFQIGLLDLLWEAESQVAEKSSVPRKPAGSERQVRAVAYGGRANRL
jgi:plasmid maintenance system antidote protein VapI